MSHPNDREADYDGSSTTGDPIDLGNDVEDAFDIYQKVGDFDKLGSEESSGGNPEDELFTNNKNTNSLREQAQEDKEIVKGELGGAPVDMRDRVVPVIMWLLFGAAATIGGKTAIDAAGPAAGPLWEFRQTVASEVWLPMVDIGQQLYMVGAPIAEHNIVVTAVLALLGVLILRNRRM